MLLPIEWLKDYIDINKSGKELADGLTLSGSHVESINLMGEGVEGLLVGKILSIEKHPQADKLFVCQVDMGEEELQIITGAKNLSQGDYVPVATVGSLLAGGLEIKKTNFRGLDSFGMLCSLQELGYKDNVISKEFRDGIFIFDKEYPLGSDVIEILGLKNEVIELEITPNRPDCLCIIGMAREAAATFKLKLKEPTILINKEEDHIKDYLNSIEIESENCSRYYARVIKDVEIGPSPLWMQKRLMEAGMRPISNIVDITNYVMFEYGEPLHAFDLERVEGKKIIVRQAKDGEKIVTLDGIERKLDSTDLIIADEKNPVAIAGVMGGLDSEIRNDTRVVLLEGANFDEKSVRLTSKKFALRSEASNRFEKGLDTNLSEIAVNRVCQLVEETGTGKVVESFIDVYKKEAIEKEISLRPERANKLLGLDLKVDDMLSYLNSLSIESVYVNGLIKSKIPTYRLDLSIEADLIEEIGRFYGFHNIESKPLKGVLTRGIKSYEKNIEDEIKSFLLGLGYNEVMTYSFISPRAYDKIRMDKDNKLREYINLINPLGEDYSAMRTTLIPTMMELLGRNFNRSVDETYAFEIGNIFIAKELPIKELPEEKKVLSMGFYGEEDFYFLKESVDIILARLGIREVKYVREVNNPSFHPGRTAKLLHKDVEIGTLGEVHIDVCENYGIDKKVYIGQFDFDKIVELANFEKKYRELPKYPSSSRDIALIVDEEVSVGQIEDIIKKHGGGLIEKIKLFDIYRGSQIPEKKKSIAFSIIYRSYERTLQDKEVNEIQNHIIKDLEERLKAQLRK